MKKALTKKTMPFTLISLLLLPHSIYADESLEEYLNLPLEDLLSIEITSVAKKNISMK